MKRLKENENYAIVEWKSEDFGGFKMVEKAGKLKENLKKKLWITQRVY